ncbi:TonB-dependent siderophore receptor [Vibrio parahaemolyticus]|uniref:TonB-dependent receptor n=1 Tax=Vibrio parahaemolyticus TaxID=670 RepID=UPI00038E4880|nr:TonB-dependent siderophore receptor [Vibrio parahaemolyticus]EJG0920998.1 TonB-dependent siderophore receptor [Vibrio parahaemolyticus O1:K68]EJG0930889.1 TonB-dependent siderophore receptor [Vibrio parahaemolyticus O1]EJG0944825.1 TonB-dependent siderophore receptor [Vibrio parahaemolyticus O10]EQM50547.1 tonB-dependent siderophore receptor family protein [Vibrio parahaemolyticus VPCR-2010]EGQ9062640.1 TonB-dependent siderophore receptor [Vibrio parahaemolyticus]
MNKLLTLTPLAVAIGSSLVVPSAVASEETNSTPSATETIQVYGHQYEGYAEHMPQSGTKTDVEWLDVPQAVSVVTKTEMQDRGAVRLVDALDGVAGVNNTLGEGSRDQFMIRGFDSLNDMYRDGMRDDGTLQSYRSLANVERVEIVKGPAGALYGRGSAGGIINLVTKRANGENFTHVKGSVGSNSQYVGQVDSSMAFSDKVNGRINLEYRQADSYVDHVDSNDFFIAPTIRVLPADGHTIDIDVEYAHQELVPYRGVPSKNGKLVDLPVSTYFGGTNDYQESDSLRVAVDYEWRLNDQWVWNNRAAFNHIELEQKGTRQGKVTGNEVSQTVNNFGYDPRTTTTLQSELIWETNDNQLMLGADFNQIDIDLTLASDKTLPPQNIYNPVVGPTPDPGFKPFRDNTTTTTGVYVQDVYTWGDLSVIGNVRYDSMDLEQQKAGAGKEKLDDDKVSYRAGLVYRINYDTSVYASLARSWQLPYAGIYINPKLAEFFHTDLKEVGAKAYLLDNALMLNAALFQIDQEQPQTNVDGDVIDKIEVRHQGIELEARGQITKQWDISVGYSYLDAEDKATGKKPNDVSDHLFSLWSTYQLDDNWRLGGGVKYVGDRYAGNDEAVALGDYTTVDLMAAYTTGRHKIQANAYNILDEKYILGATNGTSGLNQIGYGAPAEFMLSYGYQF